MKKKIDLTEELKQTILYALYVEAQKVDASYSHAKTVCSKHGKDFWKQRVNLCKKANSFIESLDVKNGM